MYCCWLKHHFVRRNHSYSLSRFFVIISLLQYVLFALLTDLEGTREHLRLRSDEPEWQCKFYAFCLPLIVKCLQNLSECLQNR